MEQDLSVAGGLEAEAGFFQFRSQFAVVVDLTVEHNGEHSRVIEHRLRRAL